MWSRKCLFWVVLFLCVFLPVIWAWVTCGSESVSELFMSCVCMFTSCVTVHGTHCMFMSCVYMFMSRVACSSHVLHVWLHGPLSWIKADFPLKKKFCLLLQLFKMWYLKCRLFNCIYIDSMQAISLALNSFSVPEVCFLLFKGDLQIVLTSA